MFRQQRIRDPSAGVRIFGSIVVGIPMNNITSTRYSMFRTMHNSALLLFLLKFYFSSDVQSKRKFRARDLSPGGQQQ